MRPICVIGLILAALAALAALGSTQDTAKTLPARLEWTVTTNWQASYQTRTLLGWSGDNDPNVTTYHEQGTIQSNLVATLEWKGKRSNVILETIQIGSANRSYILATERKYINE